MGDNRSKDVDETAKLYLELMKKCLTDSLDFERSLLVQMRVETNPKYSLKVAAKNKIIQDMKKRGISLYRPPLGTLEEHKRLREEGRDWPERADTMVGFKRLTNVQACMESVLKRGVGGDFIETGVWRGGTVIFMRAVLEAYGVTDRTVWAADSFEGLPPPSKKYPADAGDTFHTFDQLRVTVEQVKANFEKYGLLDERVRFLKGWFSDTLPTAPIERLAVLRLDGDMYGSTMDALNALYDKVSLGGFVIVDDYGCVPACKQAIHDFRAKRVVRDPIVTIDWTGAFWQKSQAN